jgi:uncharacterized iron-regulated protein
VLIGLVVSGPAAAEGSLPAWTAPLLRDHPLVGRIWAPAEAAFVTADAVAERAAAARYVLLGETHVNTDHHRLQAWAVARMVQAGRRPAVVWEMLPRDRDTALQAYLGAHPQDADGLGAAVGWRELGWPDWSIYAPIAATALANGLPFATGDLPKATIRKIGREGLAEALSPERRAALGLDVALAPDLHADLIDELRDSHCGLLPETAIGAMLGVQRARDAALADALIAADAAHGDGAVLIAGAGHVRGDRAVPWYLRQRQPDATVLTLAFLEVTDEDSAPEDYVWRDPAGAPVFDLLWFTPRAEDKDHCADLERRMKKRKAE